MIELCLPFTFCSIFAQTVISGDTKANYDMDALSHCSSIQRNTAKLGIMSQLLFDFGQSFANYLHPHVSYMKYNKIDLNYYLDRIYCVT